MLSTTRLRSMPFWPGTSHPQMAGLFGIIFSPVPTETPSTAFTCACVSSAHASVGGGGGVGGVWRGADRAVPAQRVNAVPMIAATINFDCIVSLPGQVPHPRVSRIIAPIKTVGATGFVSRVSEFAKYHNGPDGNRQREEKDPKGKKP